MRGGSHHSSRCNRQATRKHVVEPRAACTRALLDVDPRDIPLNRLCREAERCARLNIESRAAADINMAVADGLRQTAFRFLLVQRINAVAHEELEKEQIYQALYSAHLALLAGVADDEREESKYRDWLTISVQIVLARAAALEAQAEARAIAEKRFLDGRIALFPTPWRRGTDRSGRRESWP